MLVGEIVGFKWSTVVALKIAFEFDFMGTTFY